MVIIYKKGSKRRRGSHCKEDPPFIRRNVIWYCPVSREILQPEQSPFANSPGGTRRPNNVGLNILIQQMGGSDGGVKKQRLFETFLYTRPFCCMYMPCSYCRTMTTRRWNRRHVRGRVPRRLQAMQKSGRAKSSSKEKNKKKEKKRNNDPPPQHHYRWTLKRNRWCEVYYNNFLFARILLYLPRNFRNAKSWASNFAVRLRGAQIWCVEVFTSINQNLK